MLVRWLIGPPCCNNMCCIAFLILPQNWGLSDCKAILSRPVLDDLLEYLWAVFLVRHLGSPRWQGPLNFLPTLVTLRRQQLVSRLFPSHKVLAIQKCCAACNKCCYPP